MARALVTGGSGYVGHAVVRALAGRGWQVRVLDPAPPHPRWPDGIEHLAGDVRDASTVDRAVRGVDLVFHVAGMWDGRPGGDERMRALNVEGTRLVVATGAPVVYTSSSITCGYGSWDRPGTEDEPSEDPRHPIRGTGRVYRETKLEAEAIVAEAGGMVVNPDFVVGPGDVGGVVVGPLLRVARLPVAPAPRGGKCFVAVDDVGEGHVLAAQRGRPGRRYLLGAENRRYRDVLRVLADAMDHRLRLLPYPRLLPRVLAHVPVVERFAGALEQMDLERYRDASRARLELGWRPGPVDDALREAATSRG